jgi:hypothetical protein
VRHRQQLSTSTGEAECSSEADMHKRVALPLDSQQE